MADIQNNGSPQLGSGKKAKASGRGLIGMMQDPKNVQIPNWVPVVLVVVVAGVLGAMFLLKPGVTAADGQTQGTAFAEQYDPNAFMVEVMPQTVRSFDGDETSNPFVYFSSAESLNELKITGIIINSNGKGTAIIEAGGASYIVSVNDTLPESEWVVSQIEKNSVTFTLDGNDKTIYMTK